MPPSRGGSNPVTTPGGGSNALPGGSNALPGGSNPVPTFAGGSNVLPVIGKLATDLSIVKQRLTNDGKTYTVGEGTVNTSGPRSNTTPAAPPCYGSAPVAPPSVGVVRVVPPSSVASVAASNGAVTNSVGPTNAAIVTSPALTSPPSATTTTASVTIETNPSNSVPPPAVPKRIPMAAPRRIVTPAKSSAYSAGTEGGSNTGQGKSNNSPSDTPTATTVVATPPRPKVSVANDNNDDITATPELNKSNVVIVSGCYHGYYKHT